MYHKDDLPKCINSITEIPGHFHILEIVDYKKNVKKVFTQEKYGDCFRLNVFYMKHGE